MSQDRKRYPASFLASDTAHRQHDKSQKKPFKALRQGFSLPHVPFNLLKLLPTKGEINANTKIEWEAYLSAPCQRRREEIANAKAPATPMPELYPRPPQ